MPLRKLNTDDVRDLQAAYDELMTNKSIERGDRTLTTLRQVAAWKNISVARLHELRRGGWRLRQGMPTPPEDVTKVSAEAYRTLFTVANQRIAELEARVVELERQLKEKK